VTQYEVVEREWFRGCRCRRCVVAVVVVVVVVFVVFVSLQAASLQTRLSDA
jgi:hypothetical protein